MSIRKRKQVEKAGGFGGGFQVGGGAVVNGETEEANPEVKRIVVGVCLKKKKILQGQQRLKVSTGIRG